MLQLFAELDRLEREQYLDFAQLRRFRQSLLCRCESTTGFRLAPERIASVRFAASTALLRPAAGGKPLMRSGQGEARADGQAQAPPSLFEWLVGIAPPAVSLPAVEGALPWPAP